MAKSENACLFCGGSTLATVRTRYKGSRVVTETRKCKECKRHSLRVRLCE